MRGMYRVTPEALAARIEQHDAPLLLDVREAWEWAICRIEGSLHRPMSRLPTGLHDVEREREIIVVCHHGNRSRVVAQWMEREGFPKVGDLAGGLDAWARSVDPSMRTY